MADTPVQRSRIFVSYRREDAAQAAGRLAADLRMHFKHEQVFEDIASIAPGMDFMDALRDGLESAAAVVVVIGPTWCNLTDEQGRRRIDLTDDWVRQEVAYCLQITGVRVFPVLVDDARMPRAEELPEDIRSLTRRQGTPLTVRHWSKDVGLLVDQLKRSPGLADASVDLARTQNPVEVKPQVIRPIKSPMGERKANYRPLLMIGIPLMVVAGMVGVFRAGDKPAPLQETPVPAVVPEPPIVKEKPEIVPPVTAAKSAQPFALGNKDCELCSEMVVIPAGSFTMGSPDNEQDRENYEGPQRRVTISKAFAVGKYEVTRGEFARFVSATSYRTEAEQGDGCSTLSPDGVWTKDAKVNWHYPGYVQADTHPVVCVSWNDTQAYLKWLNQREPGKGFRLLSESEWEYAARAGTTTRYPWGEDGKYTEICGYANGGDMSGKKGVKGWQANWIAANCDDRYVYAAPRGSYAANPWGLHDMHGNAWEWTEDCWHENYNGAPMQGEPWTSGDCGQRVLRGGSWFNNPQYLRSALRNKHAVFNRNYLIGFRVARTL
jgi:formylglycine-generating enzyme required for sulfatase activity